MKLGQKWDMLRRASRLYFVIAQCLLFEEHWVEIESDTELKEIVGL